MFEDYLNIPKARREKRQKARKIAAIKKMVLDTILGVGLAMLLGLLLTMEIVAI